MKKPKYILKSGEVWQDPVEYELSKNADIADSITKSVFASRQNAMQTYKNRTNETIAKQNVAKEAKGKEIERIEELKKELESNFDNLSEKLVSSFKKIGVQETFKKFDSDLKSFEKLSEELFNLSVKYYPAMRVSKFDNLMLEVARNYPKCIKYLPTKYFTVEKNAYLPFNKLSKEDIGELEKKFEKEGVFNNPNFAKYYLKYFPNYIDRLTNIDDINTALTLQPSAFKLLTNTSYLRMLIDNPKTLVDIVSRAPELVKYLHKDELETLAKVQLTKIGIAIIADPTVLENEAFSSDFFLRYAPKYVFGSAAITKSKSLQAVSNYLDKFDGLKEYYGITSTDYSV